VRWVEHGVRTFGETGLPLNWMRNPQSIPPSPAGASGLNELSDNIAGIPQREAQHVKELDAVLEDWFRVVFDEEVVVNA